MNDKTVKGKTLGKHVTLVKRQRGERFLLKTHSIFFLSEMPGVS